MRTRLVLTAALLASFATLPLSGAATSTPARPYGTTWVVNSPGNSVLAYAPNASGTATPIAKIHGPATGLAAPSAIAVSSTGKLFVANAGNDSITEYAAAATGNTAPVATIGGAKTGLDAPSSLVLSGGEIWVTDSDSNLVEAFTAGETGNVLPAETIAGPKTQLDHPVAIAVSSEGFLGTSIVVVNNPPAGKASILTFTSPKRGDVAPTGQTRGKRGHRLQSPTAISQQGFLNYWITDSADNSVSEMLIFALPGGLGGGIDSPLLVRTTRVIAGAHTGINDPVGVTHDALGGPVVANAGDHSLRDFSATAAGNVAPRRVISAVGTAAGTPSGTAVFGVPPSAPTDVQARLHKSVASVTWHRPTVTGGGIAGYIAFVLRGGLSGSAVSGQISIEGSLDNPLGISTTKTRFTKRHIKPGRRYAFLIAAVNGFGTSPFSHPVKVVHVIAPSPPRRVKTLTGSHTILVSWRDARRDGGAHVHYVVRYAAGCAPGSKGCKTHTMRTGRFNDGSLRIAHLKRHTTYDLQVLAKNEKGASKPTKVVRATTQ